MSRFFPVNQRIQRILWFANYRTKDSNESILFTQSKHKVHLVKSDYRTDYSNESVLFSESKTYSTEPPMESESN